MTETTARFALPLLVPGQAQREMYHNEALALLDLLTQTAVEAAGIETPPANPEPGQCWIVGASPSGDWLGRADAVAGWTEGGWRFVAPREGMRLWNVAAREFALFRDGSWRGGEVHGRLFVGGQQVVGPRAAAVTEPVGGTVVDGAARAAISAVLAALRAHGLIDDGL